MSRRLLSIHRLHYRMGGAEAVHLDHLALFRERGWVCAEFAMTHPDNEASDWQNYFPESLQAAPGLAGIAALPRFFLSGEPRRRLVRLLDDFRPDIVHVHGVYAHLMKAILQPVVERKIPIVYTLHDYKLICPAYHFFREKVGVCERCRGGRQWNCLVHRCTGGPIAKDALYALDGLKQWRTGMPRDIVDRFVGPCRFIVDKFVEHGFAPERLRFVPNFFESEDDAPADPAAVAAIRAENGRHLLYFGRLSPEKGIDGLIDAAAAEGVPLVIVGDGPKRAELEAQADRLGSRVRFAGYLKGGRLWAHVEAAAAIVLPSVWYEIAPKSILEAQIRAKPVIASAIGGLPELVEDGVSGALVEPADRHSLARGIRRLFALDDEALAAMGARARRRALTEFTRDRYYDEMTALYDELVPGPLAGSAARSVAS